MRVAINVSAPKLDIQGPFLFIVRHGRHRGRSKPHPFHKNVLRHLVAKINLTPLPNRPPHPTESSAKNQSACAAANLHHQIRIRRRLASSSAATAIVPARPRNETSSSGIDVGIPAACSVSTDTTNGTPSSFVVLSSRAVVLTESPMAERIGVFGGPIRPTIASPV